MEIGKSISDFKSLSKVVSKCDFISLHLSSCKVSRELDALNHSEAEAVVDFSGNLVSISNKEFIAKITFSFNTQDPNDDSEKTFISIAAEYILKYSLKNNHGLTEDDIQIFCGINAVYNAWPFCREFVLDMTNKMGLPPFYLPLLKFRTLPKQEDPPKKDAKKKMANTKAKK